LVRSRRVFWFLVSIALGAALGLIYGWVIHQPDYQDAALTSLRKDYQVDLILMVAQAYQEEQDPSLALRRLGNLQDPPTARLVQQAIIDAQTLGYPRSDIESLAQLAQALQSYAPPLGSQP
jgi:hypothetical protein